MEEEKKGRGGETESDRDDEISEIGWRRRRRGEGERLRVTDRRRDQ